MNRKDVSVSLALKVRIYAQHSRRSPIPLLTQSMRLSQPVNHSRAMDSPSNPERLTSVIRANHLHT